MSTAVYTQLLLVVVDSAYLRGAGVLLAFLRTFLTRRRFVTFRMGWVEVVCSVEPLVLLAMAYALHADAPAPPTFAHVGAAVVGAVLAVAGWALLLWSMFSWHRLFAGHGVLVDHRLVTRGAYGFVRHPVYLAAFLIWGGLVVGFLSRAAFLVTVLYVIPIYLLYIRSEEHMMLEAFGNAYREYRRNVPMLIPRLRQPAAVAAVAG